MITNGTDIVYIPKIKSLIDKQVNLSKWFTQKELDYFQKSNYNPETIAGIFAAKEAFMKAMNYRLRDINFLDIEVNHNEYGAPYYTFYNDLIKKTESFKISLSISHDNNYAIATTVILK